MLKDVFDGWLQCYTGKAYAKIGGDRDLIVLYLDGAWGYLIFDGGKATGWFDAAWTAEQARDGAIVDAGFVTN